MPTIPDRLFITGGLATGKTTLAERLGGHFGHPVLPLDDIYWKDDNGTKMDPGERSAILEDAIHAPEWIIEGSYVGKWLLPGLEAADTILQLQLSELQQTISLVKREIGRGSSVSKIAKMLRWQASFDQRLSDFKDSCPHLEKKTIHLMGRKAIDGYVASLSGHGSWAEVRL